MTDGNSGGTYLNPDRRFLLEQVRFDKTIVRAKGHYLYDTAGHAYLDFVAQYGAMPFGHNPDVLWRRLEEIRQLEEPSFIQPLLAPGAEALAAELIAVAPGQLSNVVFTNSGAESMEVGIKLARAVTGRPVILSTTSGFHGKTLGAVSATGPRQYREPFLVDTRSFEHIPYNDLDSLEARLAKRDAAAFVVEAVQGEAGMIPADPGYLRAASELCRGTGTLFVIDEVQTGLGRTGRLFASDHESLDVDILLLAKALGGGLVPLGACLCAKRVWTRDFGYYHSSTFANSHLTCSVGLATLRHLLADDRRLVREVERKGAHLQEGLKAVVRRYPRAFAGTSGVGLMHGVRLAPWNGEQSYYLSHASSSGFSVPLVCGHLLNEHRIVTAPAFNNTSVIRVEPALTITESEIDRFLSALDSIGDLLEREDHATLLSYLISDGKITTTVPSRVDFSRPSPLPVVSTVDQGECLGRYAFLIHPTTFEDVVLNSISPSFDRYDARQMAAWADYLATFTKTCYEPGIAYHLPVLRSKAGGYAEGWLISCGLTPNQMLHLNRRDRRDLLAKYLDVARSLKVDMVGLGAFTSIITRAGVDLDGCGLNLTTGNSLTAMAAAESLKQVASERGIDLQGATVGVIGSVGSVGRLSSKLLASICSRIILFGNPSNPAAGRSLEALAGELYFEALLRSWAGDTVGIARAVADLFPSVDTIPEPLRACQDDVAFRLFGRFVDEQLSRAAQTPPILVSVDLERHLPLVEAVVSATNQSAAFVDSTMLAPGTVVCDVSRPPAIQSTVRSRRDVTVYAGGLMVLPEPVRFGERNVLGFPTGINLACLSECIALAMAGAKRSYSLGNRISVSEAEHVYALARHHGFEVSIRQVEDAAAKPFSSLDADSMEVEKEAS
jgi:acetylornithine/succinyldiaminopimelate/putrescine aminotransferase/predicted amino acid dehydrogenase